VTGGGSALEAFEIGLLTALLIFGSYYLTWRMLMGVRWRRRPILPTDPIPDQWREIVSRRVPVAARLTDAERVKLLRLVQVFLREKIIEGCDGLEVTEEMKVMIAAQACVLLLHLDAGVYPGLRTVLVYPGTYRPRHPSWFKYNLGSTEPLLGESWRHGVVILSWESVASQAADSVDGRNVTLHEFAHQLDQQDGVADGTPALQTPSAVRHWAAVIARHYDDLVSAAASGRDTVLDYYGATNKAEFFAVATETFFEQPIQLRQQQPELYDALREFYGQDPAQRSTVPQPPPPPVTLSP
jgi:Mlc titration factor MtfA (ptsG expression regulator)